MDELSPAFEHEFLETLMQMTGCTGVEANLVITHIYHTAYHSEISALVLAKKLLKNIQVGVYTADEIRRLQLKI